MRANDLVKICSLPRTNRNTDGMKRITRSRFMHVDSVYFNGQHLEANDDDDELMILSSVALALCVLPKVPR
jgi:hypothetical protein